MKLYLDTCSLQRPFDDQLQVRIATETAAILGVLALWEAGDIELFGSEALEYETSQIPALERKSYMNELLAKADNFITISEEIAQRARNFVANGIKPLDALHLACAASAKVDYFCTCDDKFLKRAKRLADLTIEIVSPMELVTKLPK